MNLVLTIDTEADNQWDHGRPITTENVRYWPAFQSLCERYDIVPTYLVTSEIASDRQAAEFLSSLVAANRAEVGAHLHPWTTPPYANQEGLTFNDEAHAFPSELPDNLLQAKLKVLTEQIEDSIGKRPTSFRAGRFGFDQRSAEVLSDLGYTADSSVTPLVSWRKTPGIPGKGGPDFSRISASPFLIRTHGKASLMEIPLTIVTTQRFLGEFPGWLPAYQWLQGKQNGRFVRLNLMPPQPLWLRPRPGYTLGHLCSVWSAAEALGLPVAVMMFHSSELMPGGSPYSRTEEAVSRLLSMLEEFFVLVRRWGAEGWSLSAAAQMIRGLPGIPEKSL